MKNSQFCINVSSIYGSSHEIEQAIMNMFNSNRLMPTTDGTVIDIRLDDIEASKQTSDEDKDNSIGIKDEPVKNKKTTGDNQ